MNSHRHIESLCPVCKERLDAASNADQVKSSPPECGDVSICLYCASYLIFDEDLTLQLLSVEDLLELPDEILQQLTRMRKEIKKANQKRNKK